MQVINNLWSWWIWRQPPESPASEPESPLSETSVPEVPVINPISTAWEQITTVSDLPNKVLLSHVNYWFGDRGLSFPDEVREQLLRASRYVEESNELKLACPQEREVEYQNLSPEHLVELYHALISHAKDGEPKGVISGKLATIIEQYILVLPSTNLEHAAAIRDAFSQHNFESLFITEFVARLTEAIEQAQPHYPETQSWETVINSKLPNSSLLHHVNFWFGANGSDLSAEVREQIVRSACYIENEDEAVLGAPHYKALEYQDLSAELLAELYNVLNSHAQHGTPQGVISRKLAEMIEVDILILVFRNPQKALATQNALETHPFSAHFTPFRKRLQEALLEQTFDEVSNSSGDSTPERPDSPTAGYTQSYYARFVEILNNVSLTNSDLITEKQLKQAWNTVLRPPSFLRSGLPNRALVVHVDCLFRKTQPGETWPASITPAVRWSLLKFANISDVSQVQDAPLFNHLSAADLVTLYHLLNSYYKSSNDLASTQNHTVTGSILESLELHIQLRSVQDPSFEEELFTALQANISEPDLDDLVQVLVTLNVPLVYGPIPAAKKEYISFMQQSILDVANTLDREDVAHWLDGSALLGAFRNQALIPYDDSAPKISVLFDDLETIKTLLSGLDGERYFLEDNSVDEDHPYLRVRVTDSNGQVAYIDICIYKFVPDKNKLQWMNPFAEMTPNVIWDFPVAQDFIFPLQQAEFAGSFINAPARIRDYLVVRYNDIRPDHHYNKQSDSYERTTGLQFIKEQQTLVQASVPVLQETRAVDFSSYPHTNLPLGPVPEKAVHLRQAWKELVYDLTELCQALNIPFWVDTGHLLGIYRHNEAIPWDHDCDLSTLQAFVPQLLEVFNCSDETFERRYGRKKSEFAALEPDKYRLEDWSLDVVERGIKRSFMNYYRIKIVSLGEESYSHVDLYTQQLGCDTNGLTVGKNEPYPKIDVVKYPRPKQPVATSCVFPLVQANFAGRLVPVPNDTFTYLTIRYGDLRPTRAWNDAKQEYEMIEDHPCNDQTFGINSNNDAFVTPEAALAAEQAQAAANEYIAQLS